MEQSKNLYDINKELMAQLAPLDPIYFNQECEKAAEKIWNKAEEYDRCFWMLLCRERNDYTVFHIFNGQKEVEAGIIECCNNRGKILDITEREDGNYEIWIRDIETNENFVYYLFDYSDAIVEV